MASSFPQTLWTRLIEVVQRQPVHSQQHQAAMAELYERYHGPVLSHIKRVFHGASYRYASAEDMVNAFFSHLIEKQGIATVRRDQGSFRTWLKRSAENFCRNFREREQAEKRGDRQTIPLTDAHEVEQEDAVLIEVGRIFDRRYAHELQRAVLDELSREYGARGQAALFDDLRRCITCGSEADYAWIAEHHRMKYGTLVTAITRLRQRFGMKLKHQIAAALLNPSPEDIEAEVRYLIGILYEETE